MPELFAEPPFLDEAPDFALLAGARAGAALSLLELELCELRRTLSLLAGKGISDLLFDLRERLSAGIFPSFELV